MLPESWESRKLYEVAKTATGGTPSRKKNEYYGGNIPWVKSGELNDDNIHSTKEQLTNIGLKNSSAKIFPKGTLLVALYGATVGKTSILDIDAATNQAICAIFTNQNIDTTYLRFYIITKRAELLANRYGGAQPNISQTIIRNLIVTIPPISEQHKIAAILSLVRRTIEQQTQFIEHSIELKKTLMEKIFTEGLRGEPQKITEIGSIPESWEISILKYCCSVQTGIAKGRMVDPKESVSLPYLRVANVQSGYLDLSEMKTITIKKSEKERFLLKYDDIVLTEGGDFDKLGRGFIWKGVIDECVHQNHVFVVRVNTRILLPEYFAYLSQSPYGKAYFFSVAHKTTNLACINTSKLKGFPVLIPSIDEQSEIVLLLNQIDQKLKNHQRKKQLVEELFKTLLHQLMTAQIRVNDLDLSELDPVLSEVST